ncbi:MAG TPA: thioredoxin domain-containing protein [Streptosporangiaceae bacterium]
MADRLRNATSPYLLQHADNPVDWWPWSDDAFAHARSRDVPVLLSVGYSACHWCHVMAHESFEDEGTARLINESVVPVKVDREERPDVDAVYMTATQAMTGQGGWPMTVFLTPDREPFYCGTYFPREQLKQLITAVARAWRDDRPNVADQARQIAEALAESAGRPYSPAAGADGGRGGDGIAGGERTAGGEGTAGGERTAGGGAGTGGLGLADLARTCEGAVATLARRYDARHGGFGGAPKFPPSTVLEFLLRHAGQAPPAPAGTRTREAEQAHGGTPQPEGTQPEGTQPEGMQSDATPQPDGTRQQALAMVAGTAEAMARGGIYDQLGGGFARYSVDGEWIVPHFEKMLYDNAQLASVYAHWWRRSGSALARRIAEQTCDWMIADLKTAEGGFASALDADSNGVEGAFYVWTPDELADVLGSDDGEYAARLFAVTTAGTFEHGKSVLRLPADPADLGRYERVRSALRTARAGRVWPGRDDKVVAAWNGMAIAALAEAGLLFGRPDYIAAAAGAAGLLARVHLADGRLARTSRDGVAGQSAGVLEDYACVAAGYLALSGVTGEARWVGLARELLDVLLERFQSAAGGFYDTADDSERLIYRPSDPADGPTPSGTFAAAGALLSYSALTGSARHRVAAASALGALPALAARFPQAAGWGLAVAEAFLAGPDEIAIVGPGSDPRTRALHEAASLGATPGAVIAIGPGDAEAALAESVTAAGDAAGPGRAVESGQASVPADIPLLAGRGLVNGLPAAYVCRNFSCRLPVTSADDLLALLRA